MRPSELEIFHSVDFYDEKSAENYLNCYVTKNRIVLILITHIEDLNEV